MRLTLLLLVTACASCMEMHETVERRVMYRSTGSDLQPAATGFIYKKENGGPANVVKIGESEVMEQLAKIYEQPQAFTAPLPIAAGPFYAKEKDESISASAHDARVIPVEEKNEKEGVIDEDFSKILEEYAANYENYKSDFDDYLKSLGHHDNNQDGSGHDYGSDDNHAHGDNGYKGYASKVQYGKGGAGDYHTEKHESYSHTGDGGDKKVYGHAKTDFADDFKSDEGFEGEALGGNQKNDDSYDGEAFEDGLDKYASGHHHGPGDLTGITFESGLHNTDFGEGFHLPESRVGDDADAHDSAFIGANYGVQSGFAGGKSFGYEINH